MKREIKFRGKRVNTGEWMTDMYTLIQDADGTWLQDADGCYIINPETLGQYIGLLDKNCNDIYEGDIVKSNLVIGIPNTWCNHKIGDLFVIVCLPSGYTLMAMRDYRYESRRDTPSLAWNLNNYFLWNYHNDFEVIGNIVDNPELLKGGKE